MSVCHFNQNVDIMQKIEFLYGRHRFYETTTDLWLTLRLNRTKLDHIMVHQGLELITSQMIKLMPQFNQMRYLEGKAQVPDSGPLHYLPYLFMMFANILWPLSWIHSNEHNINFAETTLVRGVTCMWCNYLICRWRKYDTVFKNAHNFNILNKRNMIMCFHSFAMAAFQFVLPLPIIHTISCGGTLLIFILDYFKNGVTINRRQALGIFFGIFGVVVTSNSSLIMKKINPDFVEETTFANYVTTDPLVRSIAALILSGIMLLWANAVIITKQLRQVNTFEINYHLGFWLLISGGIAYPLANSTTTVYRMLMSLVWTGLPLVVGQWFFIGALRMTKHHGVLTMINFTAIGYSELVSIFRYHEKPNLIVIIGLAMLIFGVWETIFRKDSQAKKTQQQVPLEAQSLKS